MTERAGAACLLTGNDRAGRQAGGGNDRVGRRQRRDGDSTGGDVTDCVGGGPLADGSERDGLRADAIQKGEGARCALEGARCALEGARTKRDQVRYPRSRTGPVSRRARSPRIVGGEPTSPLWTSPLRADVVGRDGSVRRDVTRHQSCRLTVGSQWPGISHTCRPGPSESGLSESAGP